MKINSYSIIRPQAINRLKPEYSYKNGFNLIKENKTNLIDRRRLFFLETKDINTNFENKKVQLNFSINSY